MLTQLYKEVNYLTLLSHDNIVKCLGLHVPKPRYQNYFHINLVMEYIAGGSLADYLRKVGALDIEGTK